MAKLKFIFLCFYLISCAFGQEFKKIDNGVYVGIPANGAKGQIHKAVAWCNRVFYFGTTPVTNPRRSCTNDECFMGGYLALFNIPGWNYFSYTGIDINYNYAQDHVFPVLDHMYMLCYSKFDGFYFYGIYQWQEDTGGWKEISVLKNGDHTMSRESDCSVCTCNTMDQETAYVAVYSEKTDHLKIFSVKKNPNWEGYIDMNNVLTKENALGYKTACILKTCVKATKLYGLIGSPAGCLCTWDPKKIMTVSLDTQTIKVDQTKGDNGAFPSMTNGPQAVVHMEGKWVIVGGKTASGEFVKEIWVLDLASFQWKKSQKKIPTAVNGTSLTAIQLDGVLFLGDNSNEISNYQIDQL